MPFQLVCVSGHAGVILSLTGMAETTERQNTCSMRLPLMSSFETTFLPEGSVDT